MTMLFLLSSLLLLLGPQAIIFFHHFDTTKQRISFIGVRTYILYEMFLLFLYAQLPVDSGIIIEQLMELVKVPLNIAFMVWALSTFNESKVLKAISHRRRIFYIMMGWSIAHNVTNYLFPLIASFGKQFEWRYIEMGMWSQLNLFKFCVYAILAMRFSVKAWDSRLNVPHAICGVSIVAETLRPAASLFLPSSFNWIYFAAGCTAIQLVCTLPFLADAGRPSPKTTLIAVKPENVQIDREAMEREINKTGSNFPDRSSRQQEQQTRRKSKGNKKKKKKRY